MTKISQLLECAIEVTETLMEAYSYKNEYGHEQGQLFQTDLTGRDLKKEAEEEKEQKAQAKEERKKQRSIKKANSNPNRVIGGQKAAETRRKNNLKKIYNRPIFQALNYKPATQSESLSEAVKEDIKKKVKDKVKELGIAFVEIKKA